MVADAEVSIQHPLWKGELLSGLSQLQVEGLLCDTTLHCSDGIKVRAHSCVLAAASARIHDLLANSTLYGLYTLQMENVTSSTWRLLLRFIYDGCIVLSPKDVQAVRDAAMRFQIRRLTEALVSITAQNSSVDNSSVCAAGNNVTDGVIELCDEEHSHISGQQTNSTTAVNYGQQNVSTTDDVVLIDDDDTVEPSTVTAPHDKLSPLPSAASACSKSNVLSDVIVVDDGSDNDYDDSNEVADMKPDIMDNIVSSAVNLVSNFPPPSLSSAFPENLSMNNPGNSCDFVSMSSEVHLLASSSAVVSSNSFPATISTSSASLSSCIDPPNSTESPGLISRPALNLHSSLSVGSILESYCADPVVSRHEASRAAYTFSNHNLLDSLIRMTSLPVCQTSTSSTGVQSAFVKTPGAHNFACHTESSAVRPGSFYFPPGTSAVTQAFHSSLVEQRQQQPLQQSVPLMVSLLQQSSTAQQHVTSLPLVTTASMQSSMHFLPALSSAISGINAPVIPESDSFSRLVLGSASTTTCSSLAARNSSFHPLSHQDTNPTATNTSPSSVTTSLPVAIYSNEQLNNRHFVGDVALSSAATPNSGFVHSLPTSDVRDVTVTATSSVALFDVDTNLTAGVSLHSAAVGMLPCIAPSQLDAVAASVVDPFVTEVKPVLGEIVSASVGSGGTQGRIRNRHPVTVSPQMAFPRRIAVQSRTPIHNASPAPSCSPVQFLAPSQVGPRSQPPFQNVTLPPPLGRPQVAIRSRVPRMPVRLPRSKLVKRRRTFADKQESRIAPVKRRKLSKQPHQTTESISHSTDAPLNPSLGISQLGAPAGNRESTSLTPRKCLLLGAPSGDGHAGSKTHASLRRSQDTADQALSSESSCATSASDANTDKSQGEFAIVSPNKPNSGLKLKVRRRGQSDKSPAKKPLTKKCRRRKPQKISFVGRRIHHEWIIVPETGERKWYQGIVVKLVSGVDGEPNSQYLIHYEDEDTEYVIDHLVQDYMEGSVVVI